MIRMQRQSFSLLINRKSIYYNDFTILQKYLSTSSNDYKNNEQQQHHEGKKYRNDIKTIKEDHAYCVNLVKDRDGEGYCKSFFSLPHFKEYTLRTMNSNDLNCLYIL